MKGQSAAGWAAALCACTLACTGAEGEDRVSHVAQGLTGGDPSYTQPSLSYDGDGNPCISYWNGDGGLSFARSSDDGATWSSVAVDDSVFENGLCTSLALDPLGNPRIAYSERAGFQGNGGLHYAASDDGGASWEILDLADSSGYWVALVLDGEGNPCIASAERNGAALFCLRSPDGGQNWVRRTVEVAAAPNSETGRGVSAAWDGGNGIHLAYGYSNHPAGMHQLRHAFSADGAQGWAVTVVDDRLDAVMRTAFALDGDGGRYIAYSWDYLLPGAMDMATKVEYAYSPPGQGGWDVSLARDLGIEGCADMALYGDIPVLAFARSYLTGDGYVEIRRRERGQWEWEGLVDNRPPGSCEPQPKHVDIDPSNLTLAVSEERSRLGAAFVESTYCGPGGALLYYSAPLSIAPDIQVRRAGAPVPPGDGSCDFGSQFAGGGGCTVDFTLWNLGDSDLVISDAALTGANSSQFRIVLPPPEILPAGNFAVFSLRFAPTAAGRKTAAMEIRSNDPDTSPYVFTVTGTGLGPEINVKQGAAGLPSGKGYNFGTVRVGLWREVVFTVENTGSAALQISPLSGISGKDAARFRITRAPAAQVPARSSTSMTVRFTPLAPAAAGALLTVRSNDSDEGAYLIPLAGTGGK